MLKHPYLVELRQGHQGIDYAEAVDGLFDMRLHVLACHFFTCFSLVYECNEREVSSPARTKGRQRHRAVTWYGLEKL